MYINPTKFASIRKQIHTMALAMSSVVHDFAVLYSTRVHQKDKKWSDGRLRFYEFNNKMEVYSSEQSIVATDFYPSTSKQPLESGAFSDGNVYKLPSGKMVLEFEEYLGCSERDISKLFKKAKGTPVKTEPQEGVTAVRKPPVMVKSEPCTTVASSTLKREHPVQVESSYVKKEALASNSVVKQRIRRVGLSRKQPTKQLEVTSFAKAIRVSVEDKLNKYVKAPKSNVSIPERSNRLFTQLYKELGIGVTPQYSRVRTPEIYETPEESQESQEEQETLIKTEPRMDTGRSVDDADLIHDLSEFEEDEGFMDMLHQLSAQKPLQERVG